MNASPGSMALCPSTGPGKALPKGPPEPSLADHIARRVALGAVVGLAVALLTLGLTLYRPTLASAASHSTPDLQVQKELSP